MRGNFRNIRGSLINICQRFFIKLIIFLYIMNCYFLIVLSMVVGWLSLLVLNVEAVVVVYLVVVILFLGVKRLIDMSR